MKLSYFKKLPEKDMNLEVIVEFPDDGWKEGNVVDTIAHPLEYEPTGKIIYEKPVAT